MCKCVWHSYLSIVNDVSCNGDHIALSEILILNKKNYHLLSTCDLKKNSNF